MTDPINTTSNLENLTKTEVNSTPPAFNKGANLAYWGNMPALYSENATSWPEWMHYIEGWAQDVFLQLVTGLSDTQDYANQTTKQINTTLNFWKDNINALLADWQTIIDSIPEKIRQDVINLSTPIIHEQIDLYVQKTLPGYVGSLFQTEISNYFSTASNSPETFASLSALQAAYPSGKNGVFVVADTGHKYIYSNNVWVDAGVYQAVGFADRSVKYNTVDYINLDNIKDNYVDDGKIKKWFANNDPTVINHVIEFTGNPTGDSGFMVDVNMRSLLADDETLYLNFDYQTSRQGDANNNITSVYLMDYSGNFLNNNTNSLLIFDQSTTSKNINIKITNSKYTPGLPLSFKILFALKSDYKLTINNLISNKTNYLKDFNSELVELNVDKLQNHPISLSNYSNWFVSENDKIIQLSDGSLFYNRISTSGNSGLKFDFDTDVSKDVYITTKIIGSLYSVWLLDTKDNLLSDLKNDKRLLKNFGDIQIYKITKELLNSYGLKNNTMRILISTQNQNSYTIKEISVSNQAGVGQNKNTINKFIENDGYRKESFIGQLTKDVSNLSNVNYAGTMLGGYKRVVAFDGVLKTLEANVPSNGNYSFTVANIDQYGLIVNNKSFVLELKSGYNNLDIEYLNIGISSGQSVFMDVSTAGIFHPSDAVGIIEKTVLQDADHNVEENGHSGNNIFDSNFIMPFSYSVTEIPVNKKIDNVNNSISSIEDDIQELLPLKSGLTITSPNGVKFKLVVSDDGILSAVSSIPRNVVIAGNSLTWEKGGIGMAASDGNHDYYQLVKNYILSASPNANISSRTSFSMWEMGTTTEERDTLFNTYLKPNLSYTTDLVIIQLGDNVNTAARHDTFANDADKLIKNIKSISPNATIIWVGAWFISFPTLIDEIKAVTKNNGALFADITPFRNDVTNKSYIGATRTGLDNVSWTVTSQGEADHPGDAGMLKIASTIESLFSF